MNLHATADRLAQLEAIDKPRQTAAAEQDRGSEVAHAHPLPLGVGEVLQDLERGERQIMRGLELGVERLREPGLGAEEAAPRLDLPLGEGGARCGAFLGGGHERSRRCLRVQRA